MASRKRQTPDPASLRDQVLLAALPHVAFDGWSARALAAGAEDAGFGPDAAFRAFPGGAAQAVTHFSRWADRRMMGELNKIDISALRIRDRIAAAVRARLAVVAPHREAVRRAVAFLALPQNSPAAVRGTYETVNAMWYAAGDRSVDFSFYTKRGLLAGVYASTVLYWLADSSDDFADSWAFLDRRIADVMRIPKVRRQLEEALAPLLAPLCRPARALASFALNRRPAA